MSENKAKKAGNPSGVKEFLRKRLVALKRKPETIPLIMLVVTFLVYSLRLRIVSDTTARIMGAGMGFTGFVTMLFSILSFVAFLNSFPHRKKTNLPMLVLFLLMQVVIVICDQYYLMRVTNAIRNAGDAAARSAFLVKNTFILSAYKMLNTHVVLVIITIALTVLLPLYAKLIRKINTSIEVEGNEEMADIEIADED